MTVKQSHLGRNPSRAVALSIAFLFMITQSVFLPLSPVFADESLNQAVQSDTQQGPDSPQGPASNTYTLNKETGFWENEYYTWDPNTKQTSPKGSQDYSYNPDTKMWDTTEWEYAPETKSYVPNTTHIATPPQPDTKSTPINATTIENSGPNSNNTSLSNSQSNGFFNLFYDATITNNIVANSVSGDALVAGNTSAGSALTGSATNIANVLNMLQSSWLSQSPNIATFLATFDGDIEGDLSVDPDALLYTLGLGPSANLDIHEATNSVINNNIDLVSTSGNARVSDNTYAGGAKSGDSLALVNLINMINSKISSNRSFVGMINILGNLSGDILIPSNALNAVIASTGPNSNNQINGGLQISGVANSTESNTISNTIKADAKSGNSLVSDNTSAGDAMTGIAETTLNTVNLVGQNVSAPRALLVFVNVLGNWYGLLFGDTSSLGSIETTGPGSNNQIDSSKAGSNVNIDSKRSNAITNTVSILAQSGDTEVSNNTHAGSAKSGDAAANVNILNLVDSQLRLDDWFGVLFINILGDWFGSFGAGTPNGNQGQQPTVPFSDVVTTPSHVVVAAIPIVRDSAQSLLAFSTETFSNQGNQEKDEQGKVAASNTSNGANLPDALQSAGEKKGAHMQNDLRLPLIIGSAGMILYLASRILSALRSSDPSM